MSYNVNDPVLNITLIQKVLLLNHAGFFHLLLASHSFHASILHLFNQALVDAVFLVGLKEGEESLLLTYGAAAHHHRQAFQQSHLPVKGLIRQVFRTHADALQRWTEKKIKRGKTCMRTSSAAVTVQISHFLKNSAEIWWWVQVFTWKSYGFGFGYSFRLKT